MPRQNHLPHHPHILLSRQKRTGVNEVHGYEVLHPTILLSPTFPSGLFTLGLYPVVLLAAQAIFRFIYQSLIFFLLLSERLYRLHRNVNTNKRLLAYYPSIVPWFDHICVTGTKIRLRAIVHNDLHLTRNHVPGVAHLAAICLRKGLDVLGPLPPWLQEDSRNLKVSDGSDLHLALSEISGLIRMVQALLLNSWRSHSQLPLSPASPAGVRYLLDNARR